MKYFGFRTCAIKWFQSYPSNFWFVLITLKYSVPKGSLLGPLTFLLYVDYLPQSLQKQASICMQMTLVFSTNQDVKWKCFKEFSSLCQWSIDNKLSIHFGEDKSKFILISKARGLRTIDISSVGHSIKQHETVEYLGCQLDSKLSGEEMALKVLKK